MADELNVNSLDRFRKDPGKLILEEHGSCEVPAGCGGVVLRWRNPQSAVPVSVLLFPPEAPGDRLIDGTPITSARFDLAPGPHQIAMRLDNVDFTTGLLMMCVTYNSQMMGTMRPANEVTRQVCTLPDNTWLCTHYDPTTEDWTTLDFDEGDWQPMAQYPTPTLEYRDPGGYECRRLSELGAALLGLGDVPSKQSQGALWIRKRFEITLSES